MKKTIKIITTVLVAGMAITSFVGCSKNDTTTVDNTVSEDTQSIHLDKENAIEIGYDYDEFKETVLGNNELQVRETYIDKTIKVTGEVQEIQSDGVTITIILTTPNKLGGMYVEFDYETYKDTLMDLNTYDSKSKTDGDVITVYGYGSGFRNSCLVLNYCELA